MSSIVVIGGAKGVIEGNPHGQLMTGNHNPGPISVSYSGTGRNIVENLGRLGADVSFLTTVGDDFVGKGVKAELAELSVGTELIQFMEGQNTAMHIDILNIVGDLELAFDNCDVFQCLDQKIIDKVLSDLNSAAVVGVDGTPSQEALTYLTEKVETPLYFDPASEEDAKKAKDIIGRFHTIAPNRAEAAAISGMEIFSEEQLMDAGQWFFDQGVKRIFITMSGGGVYYREGNEAGIVRPKEMLSLVNGTGAGAAFSAGILDGFASDLSVRALAEYGMAAAAVAMEAKAAVNPNMSKEKVRSLYE